MIVRARVAFLAFALGGCSILVQPDYDAIAPDFDAGPDARVDPPDGGPDSGPPDSGPQDSGPDECVPQQTLETSCDDGKDNDCDGLVDCFDFDCRGVATCCRRGDATAHCLSSASFTRLPVGAGAEVLFSGALCAPNDALVEFGPAGITRALVSDCQPINFGMELRASFRIDTSCASPGACSDYAALALTPVRTLVDGEPLISELRVVVSPAGSVEIDRAGTRIGAGLPAGTFRADDRVDFVVSLEPGPDDRGRDVLYATVDVVGRGRILERTAVMPLDTLRCISPSGTSVGLYLAIEGAGNDVHVVGPVTTSERACANPSQFRAQSEPSLATPSSCAPGGAGAPALVSYCRGNCAGEGPPQYQSDLWVDASDDQRADEIIRFVDFGICGYAWQSPRFPSGTAGDDWTARGAPGFLWPIDPEWRSAREPTLLAISDDAGATRVEKLWYAYAERTEEGSEVYAIYAGEVLTGTAHAAPRPTTPLLRPEQAGCTSVRDPLLLAHYAGTPGSHYVDGAWLVFTCEQGGGVPRSIRAARITPELTVMAGSFETVLTSAIGSYAERGVFAAEGFTEPGDPLTLRLWFLTRDGSGVHLAYAQGRSDDPDVLPSVEPYPANPILAGDSPILGGDCAAGCTLTGATVTPSTELASHYQFLIARSRVTPTGPVHDLVPLLQPAPDD